MKLLNLGILFGLSSCFYSTTCIVKYDIENSSNSEQTRTEIYQQINKLASEYQLLKDNKFSDTDTLGFFGDPYHYFKFWTNNNDSMLTLNLDYGGSFGSRKKPPYDNLLSQLTDSINQHFNVYN